MANLDLIKQLNVNYQKTTNISRFWDQVNLNESFDPDRIEKAFTNTIADLGPGYTMYFDFGFEAQVALLFIDVCSFSERYKDLNGEEIGEYFDAYYDLVIPIIYKHGGEIDKIIGDGIIAVFGPPFITDDLEVNIDRANLCAKEIIKATLGTKFTSKIAFHAGPINYFKNKSGFYHEFTMIGKPLTELFRLEGIAEDNCINYFDDTPVREFYIQRMGLKDPDVSRTNIVPWSHYGKLISNIKGTDYQQYFRIKYNIPLKRS